MSAAVAQSTRPVQSLDLKISHSQPSTPVGTLDGAVMSAPAKMAKPNKMKKAPRRQSVALAVASPSMLQDNADGASAQAKMAAMFMSLDASESAQEAAAAADGAPLTSPKMKKPMKKAGGNQACVPMSPLSLRPAPPLCQTKAFAQPGLCL